MAIAKEQGFSTYILPGISADAYLFADLGIDPGNVGCHSYDATDFLIHTRIFDGCSHLILWQISVIGMVNNSQLYDYKNAMMILLNHLTKCYPLSHEVILYEGSQYPRIRSRVDKLCLAELPNATISRIATLHIPPYKKMECDLTMVKALNIDLSHLRENNMTFSILILSC